METIEKYVAKREEIMKLDNELLRRKTIKDTSEKVAKEFSKRADDYIPRELAGVMNDLGYFAFWFFTNHMNKDGKMEEHVKEMFPDSHEMVLGYIRHHTELAEKRKKP
jgi:hypothetical protein